MKTLRKKLINLSDKKTSAFLSAIASLGRPHLRKYQDENERQHFIAAYNSKSSRNEKIAELLDETPFNDYEVKTILRAVFPPLFTPIRIVYLAGFFILLFFLMAFLKYRSLPRVYAIGSAVEVYKDPACQQKNMQQLSLFGIGVNNEKLESSIILKDSTANAYQVIDYGFFGWLFNSSTPKYVKKSETTMDIAPYEKVLEPLKNQKDLFDLTVEDRKAIKRTFDQPEFLGASIYVGKTTLPDTLHYIVAFNHTDSAKNRAILFSTESKSGSATNYIILGSHEESGIVIDNGSGRQIKQCSLIYDYKSTQGREIFLFDINSPQKANYSSLSNPYNEYNLLTSIQSQPQ